MAIKNLLRRDRKTQFTSTPATTSREWLSSENVRQLSAGLGLVMIGFGALPALAPRPFGWVFGFQEQDAEGESLMRSLGLRDAVMGVGLWSAASHGGKYAPWLLARALTDGGDVISVGIAVAQGKRNPRFIALAGLAAAATITDIALWTLAKREA